MSKQAKFLTVDDLAWVSNKLMAEYASVKYKPEKDRNVEISILVTRALNFGLDELVSRFGYIIFEIPLANNRFARLVIPSNISEADIELIKQRLEMMAEHDEPAMEGVKEGSADVVKKTELISN